MEHYGAWFAQGCDDYEKLGDVLRDLDEPSPSHLIRDHEAGRLEALCADSARQAQP